MPNNLQSLLNLSDPDFSTPIFTNLDNLYPECLSLCSKLEEHIATHDHAIDQCPVVKGIYRVLMERSWPKHEPDEFYRGLYLGFSYLAGFVTQCNKSNSVEAQLSSMLLGGNRIVDVLTDFAFAVALRWREAREGIPATKIFGEDSEDIDEIGVLVEKFNFTDEGE